MKDLGSLSYCQFSFSVAVHLLLWKTVLAWFPFLSQFLVACDKIRGPCCLTFKPQPKTNAKHKKQHPTKPTATCGYSTHHTHTKKKETSKLQQQNTINPSKNSQPTTTNNTFCKG
jgi:hypothetical protein